MNSCDHIRSILLTDYLDGELDSVAKADVEKHLSICVDCRRVLAMAKEDMSIISDNEAKVKAPPHLWRAIASRIEEEKREARPFGNIFSGLLERFTMPRLAPAIVGIILLILGSAFFFHTQRVNNMRADENFAYVSELFTGNGSQAADNGGLGTSIEEYFL